MADSLQIVDLAESGQVQVSLSTGHDQPETASPSNFSLPLTHQELAEVHWYFTEYPENTFGEAKTRAETVEAGFKDLGQLLYQAVFQSSDEAKSLLAKATGSDAAELSVVSTRPEFLSLPWELLNHGDDGYLVSQMAGVSRRLTDAPLAAFTGQMPTDQLNVLLVLPPAGDPSAEGGSIATEALTALESLPVEVSLDCLRPSSEAGLKDRLAANSGHYHLVHLDGFAIDAQGILMEDGSGGASSVEAAELANSLNAGQTPVVLINAASSSVLSDVMSFAAGLAREGVPQVVLAPLPITGAGRVLFCDRLFQGLSQGTSVTGTVASVRQAMIEHPLRPSATGPLVSWDWILPLVFESREYSPAAIVVEEPVGPVPGMPQPEQETSGNELPRGGPYGLIGRHSELLELERQFRQSPVVLLSGDVGAGKSELALGLASWLRKTGGRSGGVFYLAFEVGAGLERVLHEIGTSLVGLDFADLKSEQRMTWVVDYLRENPALLVFDSLQNLAGFPTGAPGLLDENEMADLDSFLKEVAEGGQTWALLVSRREQESWLTVPHGSYRLGGLSGADQIVFGTRLLEEAGADPIRLGPEYLEILEMVDGHPLAMEIALPLLKEVPASVLTGELRSELDQHQAGADEEGRPAYLTVVMDHAFSRMTRRSRTHLPFLSMFRSRVMMDILTHITQEGDAYKSVTGEQLGYGACRTLLRTARASGFLEPITPSVYQIHPSLPWFYGRSLYRQFPQSAIQQLEQEIVRVYADTADYFMETLYENQDAGTNAILAEEGNITQALALSLEAGQWENAQLLVQPLAQVYRMQKRYPELRRLRRQLLETAGATAEEAEKTGGIDLWLYLLGTEASECIETREFDRADDLNKQLLEYLGNTDDGETDPRTAAVFHQMGQVAQSRWNLEEAERLFTHSLAIIEGGEDQEPVADDYYGLGLVCQYRRRYTEAKEWFSKALEIHQRINDGEEMVKDYRSLGLCAQYQFEYDEAASWYQRAREILEEARDEETAVLVYHSLGTVCHAQYQFDEAENWYQQSLSISDRMGNDAQMGVEFHHLGLVEQAREMFVDDAEHWYRMALEKWQKVGDRRSEGDECRQLGVLFHQQKDLDKAEEWYGRARDVFEDIQDLNRICRTYGQLGMVAEERDDLPGALLWAGRTYKLAVENDLAVLIQAKAHLARLKEKHGENNFTEWWREFADEEPPSDLEVDPETVL
ncbi:MAG: tetratricopeptide repeat protein [Chloroflexi bacterium]|nr:tetratricopeptide repeat protein [Chloroflexota bacterium]